ncbi:MAG: arginine--tRNA ligase [Patescibacteria group bacterium]|nr:arginine--tRNA ligase [Patescibacteria group bacterium]
MKTQNLLEFVCYQLLFAAQTTVNPDFSTAEFSPSKLKKPPKPELGDFAFPCFQLKDFGDPADIAVYIQDFLQTAIPANDLIKKVEVQGPFVNIHLNTGVLAQLVCSQILEEGPNYGTGSVGHGQRVMIEFLAPNSNKPLHLGHVRNALLGASISRIFQAMGFEVIRANLINDRGAHICKSIYAWQTWGNGETPQSTGIKGDHFVGRYYALYGKKEDEAFAALLTSQGLDPQAPLDDKEERKAAFLEQYPPALAVKDMLLKWEASDPKVLALWQMMNGWTYAGFDATLAKLGIVFDRIYYESTTYLLGRQHVLDGLSRGVFYRKEDGAVYADLKNEGLDDKLLLRSDGTSVYITQDIGTAILKSTDYQPLARSVYIVGSEQIHHFKVLFLLLKMLDIEEVKNTLLYHLPYGMVNLPEGKMKSRLGKIVDADDLIRSIVELARTEAEALNEGREEKITEVELDEIARQVGLGALKFFFLDSKALSEMRYDPKKSIAFNGRTGPFVQYTYARIASLLRKAEEIKDPAKIDFLTLHESDEHSLLLALTEFGAVIQAAAENYDPSKISAYLFDLARIFNRFYASHRIFSDDVPKQTQLARLALCKCTGVVIKKGLDLLGIEAPEKM